MAEEKRFENRIKAYLDTKVNVWYVKFFANAYTKVGVPDLLACVNGNFVAIEVKASKGKPSALQLFNIEAIRQAGGTALVLYPDQYDEFTKMIDELCK